MHHVLRILKGTAPASAVQTSHSWPGVEKESVKKLAGCAKRSPESKLETPEGVCRNKLELLPGRPWGPRESEMKTGYPQWSLYRFADTPADAPVCGRGGCSEK